MGLKLTRETKILPGYRYMINNIKFKLLIRLYLYLRDLLTHVQELVKIKNPPPMKILRYFVYVIITVK